MKRPNLTFSFVFGISIAVIGLLLLFVFRPVASQTRERTINANRTAELSQTGGQQSDGVKVDVDLVTVDALVLQKENARIIGGLKKEDFAILEDGVRQQITHFSQDSLPLSVMLLIARGSCVDPNGDEVHRAAREAIDRLNAVDEVAVMSYPTTTTLVQGFTR